VEKKSGRRWREEGRKRQHSGEKQECSKDKEKGRGKERRWTLGWRDDVKAGKAKIRQGQH